MWKKKFVKGMAAFIFFLIMGISITGCSRQPVSSESSYVSKQDPKATVSLSDGRIKLYPYTEKDYMYTSYILEIDGKQKHFPWSNIADTMWNPRLYLNNIGGDDGEELVVILILGKGTGVYIEEVHVINPRDFEEINVDTPLDAIKDRVKTQITKGTNESIIRFYIDGKEENIQVANELYKGIPAAGQLFNTVAFGNQIYFHIANNKLVVVIAAQVSIMQFIGNIVMTYDYDRDKNAYNASRIELQRYGVP